MKSGRPKAIGYRQYATRLLVAVILFGIGGLAFFSQQKYRRLTPSFVEVKTANIGSQTLILDRDGVQLESLRSDYEVMQSTWVPLSEFSPAIVAALIGSEDQRFYSHSGVDWLAIVGSVYARMRGHGRGASTLSMQVTAMVRRDLAPHVGSQRTLIQKAKQILAAMDLEAHWSKAEILETYLNLVPMPGEVRGIPAAADIIFGTGVAGLDNDQASLLVGLIPAPNGFAERIRDRTCAVYRRLEQEKTGQKFALTVGQNAECPWSIERVSAALNSKSQLPSRSAKISRPVLGHYVVKRYRREKFNKPPGTIKTTINGELQLKAISLLKQNLSDLAGRNVGEAAALVVENHTGHVLAYANVSTSDGSWVDGIQAKRQAGSTLKPFLYGHAFDRGLLKPTSLVSDRPIAIAFPTGVYAPENYNQKYLGDVEARLALASSLNIPAVNVIRLTGSESFVRVLNEFGISDLKDGDFYGPALALGAVDVSLWQLVDSYRRLALIAFGAEEKSAAALEVQAKTADILVQPMTVHLDDQAQPRALGPLRTFSETLAPSMSTQSARQVSAIIGDRGARSPAFGLENSLSLPFWAAVKTGTSKDMRDNWCIGFSERFTVGVWVGNHNGEPMWSVSGVDGAAPAWRSIMLALPRPNSGTAVWTNLATDAVRTNAVSGDTQEGIVRIQYPPQGAILAWDPDIPPSSQRVAFAASARVPGTEWQLERVRDLTKSATMVPQEVESLPVGSSWPLRPGYYRLSLQSIKGRQLDSITFEVR